MSLVELREFKNQLDELLGNNFIRPSVSSRGAPFFAGSTIQRGKRLNMIVLKVQGLKNGVCREGLMKIDENGGFRWKKWWRG